MSTNTITIPTPRGAELTVNPATRRKPILTAEEAQAITTEIRHTSTRLWVLVTEAHDRRAHFALGYDTWDDYVRAELQMSPANAYQLLDTGHVMRELAAAGADIETPPPPRRVVAKVKDRLPEVRRVAAAAVKRGDQPIAAVRELARQPRTPVPGEPAAPTAKPRTRVRCPACDGTGKVPRGIGNRIRSFLMADRRGSPD